MNISTWLFGQFNMTYDLTCFHVQIRNNNGFQQYILITESLTGSLTGSVKTGF